MVKRKQPEHNFPDTLYARYEDPDTDDRWLNTQDDLMALDAPDGELIAVYERVRVARASTPLTVLVDA